MMTRSDLILDPKRWFGAARDRVLTRDWEGAPPLRLFGPAPSTFNWALDYFDQIPRPDRRALVVVGSDGVRTASFEELTADSNRAANFLRANGASPGDVVLVMMRNSFDYFVVKLACIKLGLPLLSIFTTAAPVELRELGRQARVRHVIADAPALESLSNVDVDGLKIVAGDPPVCPHPFGSMSDGSSLSPDPARRTTHLGMGRRRTMSSLEIRNSGFRGDAVSGNAEVTRLAQHPPSGGSDAVAAGEGLRAAADAWDDEPDPVRVREPTAPLHSQPTLRCAAPSGWLRLEEYHRHSAIFTPTKITRPSDALMGYRTSGTTSRPKLVWHSHWSYPGGHLSSLFWHGIARDDVHLNISPTGWAKHAWSSFFVPFLAEATAVVFAEDRPAPEACLDAMRRLGVTSFCAPPYYWRVLVRAGLGEKPACLHIVASAGEPLDEDVADHVRRSWGLRIRNGYGQTEATAMIGFAPGDAIVPGGLGYALPGYAIKLVDPVTGREGDEGEICLDKHDRPVGLMLGYADETGTPQLPGGRYYRTGDLARRDERGCFHLLGRLGDLFKSYDVRVAPVEIERVLNRHPLVAEVAVFAIPDAAGELVPAAACVAANSAEASALPTALIYWQRDKLPASHQVARVWVVDALPKTPSGKVIRGRVRETLVPSPRRSA